MSDDHRNRLSVYIAFAEPGGEVIEVASSLLGAGTAVVLHAVPIFASAGIERPTERGKAYGLLRLS